MTQEVLRTARLVLRDAGPKDVDEVHTTMAMDFDVVRCTGSWVWPADREFTAARCLPLPPEIGLGGVVMQGRSIVGMATVFGDGELGYMFARAHWGQGFATEICDALVKAAFANGRWGKLRASVFTDNPGSAHVLRKLGFTEGDGCTGHCASRGAELPVRNFTLERPQA